METTESYKITNRMGIILLADGKTYAKNLTYAQVIAEFAASRHIGTNLDRYFVEEHSTGYQMLGSKFEELA